MESVSSFALIKSYNYIKKTQDNNRFDMNYDMLEPLSIIINLALVSYMKEKTKIAVDKNRIVLQKPKVYQGILRMSKGYNREHISYLLKPIIRFTDLYPIVNDNQYTQYNESLKFITKRCVLGLLKLKSNYLQTSTVGHSIDLYISLLNTYLGNLVNNIDINIFSNKNNDLQLSVQTKINIENIFKDFWNNNEIILIASLLKDSDRYDYGLKNNILSIKNLLKSKQPNIDKIVVSTQNLF